MSKVDVNEVLIKALQSARIDPVESKILQAIIKAREGRYVEVSIQTLQDDSGFSKQEVLSQLKYLVGRHLLKGGVGRRNKFEGEILVHELDEYFGDLFPDRRPPVNESQDFTLADIENHSPEFPIDQDPLENTVTKYQLDSIEKMERPEVKLRL